MPLRELGNSARIVSRASDCESCQDLQAGTCHIGSGSMNWRCMYYVSHRYDARRITQLPKTVCTLAAAMNHQMVMRRKNSMWKKHDLASKQQICKLQYSLTQQLIAAVQFIAKACTSAACWSGHAFSVCCSCSSPSSCAAAIKCCFPCCGQMLHCLACNGQIVWTSLCAMHVLRLDPMQTSQHADIKACSIAGCICAQLYFPLLECQYASFELPLSHSHVLC